MFHNQVRDGLVWFHTSKDTKNGLLFLPGRNNRNVIKLEIQDSMYLVFQAFLCETSNFIWFNFVEPYKVTSFDL